MLHFILKGIFQRHLILQLVIICGEDDCTHTVCNFFNVSNRIKLEHIEIYYERLHFKIFAVKLYETCIKRTLHIYFFSYCSMINKLVKRLLANFD